jgi:class 3 adenylate cyclase
MRRWGPNVSRGADQPNEPTGTVTFLFTDIEGSTRLLRQFGPERYAEALADHRRVLRHAFAAEGVWFFASTDPRSRLHARRAACCELTGSEPRRKATRPRGVSRAGRAFWDTPERWRISRVSPLPHLRTSIHRVCSANSGATARETR